MYSMNGGRRDFDFSSLLIIFRDTCRGLENTAYIQFLLGNKNLSKLIEIDSD
ncbi:hypothetical protein K439DRAFT_555491 [Ramaria rubella]|nr:hypothetical protein K439DRAFT_555491 [Ramaria rubella]